LVGAIGPAEAHEPSRAYLTLAVEHDRVEGRLDVAIRDLEDAIGIDTNGDRVITWSEIESGRGAMLAYVRSRVRLTRDGGPCDLAFRGGSLDRHAETPFAVMEIAGSCSGAASRAGVTVDYGLLFGIDATHRALLRLSVDGRTTEAVLSNREPTLELTFAELTISNSLRRFIVEGIFHIWAGYDHLVFLGLLIFPAVLRKERGSDDRVSAVALRIAKIVTAFTVAHSLTLGLAVYGIVNLPARPVEAVIAASIVLAGLANLVSKTSGIGIALAFGFGRVHGLGVANALAGLSEGGSLVSLAGFNLGVELGQLVVVAALLPLLLVLRRAERWRRPALAASSLAFTTVGLVWLMERIA
jgi:hypothetical protein